MQTRKPLRLRNCSYNQPGYYFVTACTYQRKCLFGTIIDNKMCLNAAGSMIDQSLNNIIGNLHTQWQIDTYVIMPNHIHVILVKNDIPPALPLPRLMQHFKSYTTLLYIRGVHNHRWPPFEKKIWQRSYHDHILRNNDDLKRIRKYVLDNPAKWALDINHYDQM